MFGTLLSVNDTAFMFNTHKSLFQKIQLLRFADTDLVSVVILHETSLDQKLVCDISTSILKIMR